MKNLNNKIKYRHDIINEIKITDKKKEFYNLGLGEK